MAWLKRRSATVVKGPWRQASAFHRLGQARAERIATFLPAHDSTFVDFQLPGHLAS
jgi:hypothetical protein